MWLTAVVQGYSPPVAGWRMELLLNFPLRELGDHTLMQNGVACQSVMSFGQGWFNHSYVCSL